jgi:hypothetical protein
MDNGAFIMHRCHGISTDINVEATRAVTKMKATITQRFDLDGVEADAESDCRFCFFWTKMNNGEWRARYVRHWYEKVCSKLPSLRRHRGTHENRTSLSQWIRTECPRLTTQKYRNILPGIGTWHIVRKRLWASRFYSTCPAIEGRMVSTEGAVLAAKSTICFTGSAKNGLRGKT